MRAFLLFKPPLSELALGFGGLAQSESNYKRLQRFFRGFDLEYPVIARTVANWMQNPQPWVLRLDRTTWEFGTHCYNILTLGIVHEGLAFPVLWWMLDKKGNSNSDERMRLVEEFCTIFPTVQVEYLCGDREFVGQAWLRYLLLEPSMPFRLRIRATDKIEHKGRLLASKVAKCLRRETSLRKTFAVFAHLKVGQSQTLQGACRVWRYPVAVEALRLEDGKLLVVTSLAQMQPRDL